MAQVTSGALIIAHRNILKVLDLDGGLCSPSDPIF